MKRILLVTAFVCTVILSAMADDAVYAINFSESQAGWSCVQDNGKPWAFDAYGFYENGKYIPCVTMKRNYSGTSSQATWISPAINIKPGKYEVRTLALKEAGNPQVRLSMVNTAASSLSQGALIGNLTLGTHYDPENRECFPFSVNSEGSFYFFFEAATIPSEYYTPFLFFFEIYPANAGGTTVEEALPVPYSIDFTKSNSGWQSLDMNGDGSTWKSSIGLGMYVEPADADDSYLSPAVRLEKDKYYEIAATIQGAYVYPGTELSLWYSKNGGNLTKITDLDIVNQAVATRDAIFKADATAAYQFAINIKTPGTDYTYDFLYLRNFSIEESEDITELPGGLVTGMPMYTADFSAENGDEGWTSIDANGDGTTWTLADNTLKYNGMVASRGADDYIVSPAFNLIGGQDYTISYTLTQQSAFDPDHFEVLWGNQPTATALVNKVNEHDFYGTNGHGNAIGIARIIPETTGTYHIAIHLTGAEPNGSLALRRFVLTPVVVARPSQPSQLAATSNPFTQKVDITWLNPELDTKGIRIVQPLSINVYENGNLVTTLTDQTPGATGSYSYSPANFSGENTFSVAAVIGTKVSDRVETTINLDDFIGDEVLVHEFVFSRNTFNDWKVENVVGPSTWQYQWGTCFSFYYNLGNNELDWIISPAVSLKRGERYLLRYELKTQERYFATIDVTIGSSQSASAQTRVLKQHYRLFQNNFGPYNTPQFSVEADGNYHFGFKVTEPECTVELRALKVYRIENTPAGIDLVEVDVETVTVNPVTGEIILPEGARLVGVYDMNGRAVVPGNHLKGIFIVKAVMADGRVSTVKFSR